MREDVAAQKIERGPGESGVFARLGPDGRRIALLDDRGRPVRTLGPGSGLVAATASGDQAPTWIVTGTDDVGVAAAAAAIDEDRLTDRFALAIEAGRGVDLRSPRRGALRDVPAALTPLHAARAAVGVGVVHRAGGGRAVARAPVAAGDRAGRRAGRRHARAGAPPRAAGDRLGDAVRA